MPRCMQERAAVAEGCGLRREAGEPCGDFAAETLRPASTSWPQSEARGSSSAAGAQSFLARLREEAGV